MRSLQVVLLAVALGAASAASAQQSEPNRKPRAERRTMEQRPDFFAGLLRGIDLSAAQQERISTLREQYRPAGPGMRGEPGRGQRGDSARARQGRRPEGRAARGDTAQMRQNREQGVARMEAQRVKMIAEVRALLTPAQHPKFDQNLTQMQQRFEQGRARGPRGANRVTNGVRGR